MALQTEKKPISEKDIEVETSQVSSDAEQITYSSKMESDIESDQITNSETAAENIVKPEKQLPASITLGQGKLYVQSHLICSEVKSFGSISIRKTCIAS